MQIIWKIVTMKFETRKFGKMTMKHEIEVYRIIRRSICDNEIWEETFGTYSFGVTVVQPPKAPEEEPESRAGMSGLVRNAGTGACSGMYGQRGVIRENFTNTYEN